MSADHEEARKALAEEPARFILFSWADEHDWFNVETTVLANPQHCVLAMTFLAELLNGQQNYPASVADARKAFELVEEIAEANA